MRQHSRMIDLRSDTVTRPTPEMRRVMASAEVGDDVYGEDPTTLRLQETMAERLGKQAALFVPSGTMANQLALMSGLRRGDEVICGEGAHCAWFESGAGAALAGVQFMVAGKGGLFTRAEAERAIKPVAYYYPRTSLIAIENTHNRAGGKIFPQPAIEGIAELARSRQLGLHLDGARLWNVHVQTGQSLADLADPFHTISLCFSKGLGAPVGSVLLGSADQITEAHRLRKMLGAGMRQVGILSAAALYAAEHHVERLALDHANAFAFSERLRDRLGKSGESVHLPETNIVLVDVPLGKAAWVVEQARLRGVLCSALSDTITRFVFHLDVAKDQVLPAADAIGQAIASVTAAPAG